MNIVFGTLWATVTLINLNTMRIAYKGDSVLFLIFTILWVMWTGLMSGLYFGGVL